MMIKFNHRLRMRFVAALVVFGLAAGFAGSAQASGPSLTPNGWIGACNMMNSDAMAGYFAYPPFGPMVHNATQNTNGNDGMFHAVTVSGGCY